MKKITIAFSVLLLTIPAFAGMGLVQTNFWQSPYPSDYKVMIKNSSRELLESCQQLDKVAWNVKGTSQIWRADQMARIRTAPLPSQNEETFQIDFEIQNMKGFNLLSEAQMKELPELVAVAASVDAIPNFSQVPSEVMLNSSTLSNLNFVSQPKSLTKVSESFGLTQLPITAFQNQDGSYLRIISKDVACDLILHRVVVGIKTSAVVKISLAQQITISNFYAKVESISKSVVEARKNPVSRAALLGFRLGGFLGLQPLSTPQIAEAELVAIMEKFFDIEKMDLNSRWTYSNGQKFLSVPGQSSGINVQINLMAE